MKKIKTFILMMLLVGFVFAQDEKDVEVEMIASIASNKDTMKTPHENSAGRIRRGVQNRANKYYDDLGFMASADIYQHLVDEKSQEINLLANIANSYRLNGITDQAEYWYSRFIHLAQKPEHYLHYAEVLKSNGNCKSAEIWFNKYKSMGNEGLDVEAVNDCSQMQFLKKYDKIEIELADGLNSESLDFCARPYKNGVVFTSSREMKRSFKTKDFWTNEPFSDLFYAEQDGDGKFKKPELIEGKLNTKTHDGVASFDKTGSVMVFTRNDKKGEKNLQVFIARKKTDGYWSNAGKMAFNKSEYSSCHGTLSRDNSKIYFSSDRPEGEGGFDLYVSKYVDGQWGEAKNLGPEVNSSGNETFPFIAEEGTLYYSSDGHKGLGGLDVFVSKLEEESWGKPEHLGSPVNSSKDDFGFYINNEKTQGYISSNRKNGEGRDNIYTLKMNGQWPFDRSFFNIDIAIFEEGLDLPLSGVNVKVIEKLPEPHADQSYVESFWITEEDGKFDFLAKRNMTYLFEIEKKGYKTLKKYITAEELLNNATFEMDVVEQRFRDFTIKLENEEPGKPVDAFEVLIKNKDTEEEMQISFSKLGNAITSLQCGNKYDITLMKDGEPYETLFLQLPENCDKQIAGELVFKNMPEGEIAESKQYFEVNNNLPKDRNPENWTKEMFKEYFLNDKNGEFKEGQVIALRDVFYDYDRYEIRKDASFDLDRVAALMKQFPDIKIVLEAHTDVRGEADYNAKLSEKRAEKARAYVLQKGVDASRVLSKGLGESNPRVNCDDCTEQDHQLNRRTEIRLMKF